MLGRESATKSVYPKDSNDVNPPLMRLVDVSLVSTCHQLVWMYSGDKSEKQDRRDAVKNTIPIILRNAEIGGRNCVQVMIQ